MCGVLVHKMTNEMLICIIILSSINYERISTDYDLRNGNEFQI